MKPQRQINQEYLTGERPLFGESGLQINHTLFGEGESPLKECHQIEMENSMFQWKYPLWYSSDIEVKDSTWAEMARAGVWYTNNIHIENALIEAPKNFRRCNQLKLDNVFLPNAAETLWNCSNVTLNQVCAKAPICRLTILNWREITALTVQKMWKSTMPKCCLRTLSGTVKM